MMRRKSKRKRRELPLAPFERLLRNAGAKRVSKSAAKQFAAVMADYAHELSDEAIALAKHAGRKTITDSDVRMAKRKMS